MNSSFHHATVSRRGLMLTGAAAALATPFLNLRAARAQGYAPIIRRDATRMAPDDPFFGDYAQAVNAMHELETTNPNDKRSWRNQALMHLEFCPHGRPDFFAWHRHYLRNFELACADLIGKPDFALAYWDWTNNNGRVPAVFYDSGALNVTFWNDPSNAQSDNWSPDEVVTIGHRLTTATFGIGDHPVGAPIFTQQGIADRLKITDFGDFQDSIEGQPHGMAHVITGNPDGHMVDGMSPLDPIFWLHHGNVDRLWAEWQAAGNSVPSQPQTYDGQFVDGQGNPVTGATAANAVDFEAMGFTYDTLAGDQPVLVAARAADASDQPIFAGRMASERIALGRIDAGVSAKVGAPAEFSVSASGLLDGLFRARTFRTFTRSDAAQLGAEPGRVLAVLDGVVPTGDNTNIVGSVYVKSDAAGAEPQLAGTFAFFGWNPAHVDMGGRRYVVDVTDVLRDQAESGTLGDESVEFELRAVPLAPGARAEDGGFNVKSIELVGV